MFGWLRSLFERKAHRQLTLDEINSRRLELETATDDALRDLAAQTLTLRDTLALTAVVAQRQLALRLFDEQLQGALALVRGRIAEMQTGEGKTLAAVPAIVWYARRKRGVHVMTANDYLARRDAAWMSPIYAFLNLSVGCIQQGMSPADRKAAYSCDVTYCTANEAGFDYLRDQLALYPAEQVHRPFAAAVVDEADSLLIDEARIPLVIAGGETAPTNLASQVDNLTRTFILYNHYRFDEYRRNVALTDAGIAAVERAFNCGNLFNERNLELLSAVQDSLHAHALLRRNVDYLVKNGAVEPIDEFKGRIAENRRWPAGLQAAIEAKEHVEERRQGRILGSIALWNLIALYPEVCGMTGTARTEAQEFKEIYGLDVEVIPTHLPVARIDGADSVFPTRWEKENALVEEIVRLHTNGQPVLVGTASVEESDGLSHRLWGIGIPNEVLNARNDELEAGIIARAGERSAVTISTNMAGRGTDIRLGKGVLELGGLCVLGTNRNESRRIDNQLRGRAGRQGDPGRSQFFVSLQDPLLVKYGIDDPLYRGDPEAVQRVVEGQNFEIRKFLRQYDSLIEARRLVLQERRQALLEGRTPSVSELHRLVSLRTIDDLWAEYLAAVRELRDGIHWVSLGGGNPFHDYLQRVHALFEEVQNRLDDEIQVRLAEAETAGIDPTQRGSTWTYLTSDEPFGRLSERFARGLIARYKGQIR